MSMTNDVHSLIARARRLAKRIADTLPNSAYVSQADADNIAALADDAEKMLGLLRRANQTLKGFLPVKDIPLTEEIAEFLEGK